MDVIYIGSTILRGRRGIAMLHKELAREVRTSISLDHITGNQDTVARVCSNPLPATSAGTVLLDQNLKEISLNNPLSITPASFEHLKGVLQEDTGKAACEGVICLCWL